MFVHYNENKNIECKKSPKCMKILENVKRRMKSLYLTTIKIREIRWKIVFGQKNQ